MAKYTDKEVDEIRATADEVVARLAAASPQKLNFSGGAKEIAKHAFNVAEELHDEYIARYGRRD